MPQSTGSVRSSLRAVTAPAHARVDAAFGAFVLTSRDGYGRFLQAQARALLPLEAALDAGGAERVVASWPARRRTPALEADLAELGLSVPAVAPLAAVREPAAILGTIYVLEGSRLGGALLKRSIPPALPATFLAPGPAALWRDLLTQLETALSAPALQARAIDAALATFAQFERRARDATRLAA